MPVPRLTYLPCVNATLLLLGIICDTFVRVKKRNAYIAILFLISLAASTVPKSLWHDCDHGHAEAEHESDDILADDCAICDYNFTSYTPSVAAPILSKIILIPTFTTITTDGLTTTSGLLLSSRGPPLG